MTLLKTILRRVIVVWCLYGISRWCILVNPLVVRLAGLIYDGEIKTSDVARTWFWLILAAVFLIVICLSLHVFTKWLFNEK
jgi:hypothetical protein